MTDKPKPPVAEASESNEAALIKAGIAILYRFNRAFRMSKIYEANNLIFLRQIQMLLKLIGDAFANHGAASFSLRKNSLLFNDTRVKFGFSTYYLWKFVSAELSEKEIGELAFDQGITESDLVGFILTLAKKTPKSETPYSALINELEAKQIQHIHVAEISESEKTNNPNRAAKDIYFLSMTHLKDIFHQQESTGKKAALLTTKRLMQSIFNHISDNESFVYGLTNIKNFDEYTLNHSVNVCILSISLGKKVGLDRKELVDLGLSAFFHDLGKLDIPKDILLKPGKLEEQERLIIEQHPHFGAEKLVQLQEFSYLPLSALNVAMEHHSWENDSGYPHFTKKKNINLYSKIVKIVDVFDAITTERPYRQKNYTQEDALKFMMERAGTEFDPLLLKIFVNMMGAHPVGTLVLLNTGEIGIVFENQPEPQNLLRPVVKLITDSSGNKKDGYLADLSEKDPDTEKYVRTIVKSLDPQKYGVRIPDYFVASAD